MYHLGRCYGIDILLIYFVNPTGLVLSCISTRYCPHEKKTLKAGQSTMNEDLFPTEHEDFFDVMLGFQGCRLVKVSGIEEVPTSREFFKRD